MIGKQFMFDLFVIGGGSGGIAAASAAGKLGASVGLADFVKPSPYGTKWGLGGTCVNVGCIPKKLFHYASILGETKINLHKAGWGIDIEAPHSWEALSSRIGDHIHSLNFKYKSKLLTEKITYFNKLAKLISPNQIALTNAKGETEIVTAKNILIATGGRPSDPGIEGKEYAISSDDIFWLQKPPGKTLIVGASYIALECGGFLNGLGMDVSVMVRSILLRGFDQHIAQKIGQFMAINGVRFINKSTPISIHLNQENKKVVKFQKGEQIRQQIYDTVMFAIGRTADTKGLGLQQIGVKTAKNGKIIASQNDQTTVENIFAIGDVCQGRLQLTPTAIMAGRLLAKRLFGGETRTMSYKFVPTTVFTPLQYGSCGYSQEEAKATFGEENIVAYGSVFKPLQWQLNDESEHTSYAKLVVNKKENNRVVGLHFLGPHAGEVTQGFAVAIMKGCTKEDFDHTVGIHPTAAEEFTLLSAIAGSAEEKKQGC